MKLVNPNNNDIKMSDNIKILFTADLHLGCNSEEIKIPDDARINTFKKIIQLAADHDLLLIAGDFIDSKNIDNELLHIIKNEFNTLKEKNTEVIITPGFGEQNSNGFIHSSLFDLNANTIFSTNEFISPYLYAKNDQKLYLYGVSASKDYDISKIIKTSDDGFHMGLFYVDFDPEEEEDESQIYKIKKSDIKKLKLDFYALGSNHNFRMFKIQNKIIGAYPGTPEATTFDETGDRYVISININKNEIYQIKRLTVNSIGLINTEINCSGKNPQNLIFSNLEKNMGKNIIQKLTLSGIRNFNINIEDLRKYSENFFHLEVIDQSIPSINILTKKYSSDDNLMGKFYQILENKIEQNNIPDGIDPNNLAFILDLIAKQSLESLEEWLCSF